MNAHSPSAQPALNIAVVGATGVVGGELIQCLRQSALTIASLRLLASPRSAGKTIPFAGQDLTVEAITDNSFEGIDLAFFAAGATLSRQYAAAAQKAGAQVIDLSSAYRMEADVPLIVPEANAHALQPGVPLIANPNCVAAIATVALAPLHQRWSIRRLGLVTYQSASGGGLAAMDELRDATAAALAGETHEHSVLPHPYAFNLFSHNADIDADTGYNGEELKVIAETRRILDIAQLPISVTCVRVPVLRAHSMAVTVRFEDHVTPDQVRAALRTAPGIRLVDNVSANHFPMPSEASGQGDVLAGRIRTDLGDPSGRTIAMFLSGDQLLKGAALNAVQIAERLFVPQAA